MPITIFASAMTRKLPGFSISGYSGQLPVTIQNMPEEQIGAVYGAGDGSLHTVNYQKETDDGAQKGLNGLSSSIFITRNLNYIFAANQQATVLTVVDNTNGGTLRVEPAGSLPRERQSRWIRGDGVCAEFQLWILRAQVDRQ